MRTTRTLILVLALGSLLGPAGCNLYSGGPEPPTPTPNPALTSQPPRKENPDMLTVKSSTFSDGGKIPLANVGSRAGGANRSIQLEWRDAPRETQSFLIAMIDEHPVARRWVHWVVADIPPNVTSFAEGASGTPAMPAQSRELRNTGGRGGYDGPSPPPGSGDHEYVTTVYALDAGNIEIGSAPTAADVERAVAGHVLAKGSITGVYGR